MSVSPSWRTQTRKWFLHDVPGALLKVCAGHEESTKLPSPRHGKEQVKAFLRTWYFSFPSVCFHINRVSRSEHSCTLREGLKFKVRTISFLRYISKYLQMKWYRPGICFTITGGLGRWGESCNKIGSLFKHWWNWVMSTSVSFLKSFYFYLCFKFSIIVCLIT